jgi:hypothetical protein
MVCKSLAWRILYTHILSRRVKVKFLDAKNVPYLSRIDNEENIVVLFESTRSWLKARCIHWRINAEVQNSIDYKACFERLAALSPEVAMHVLDKGDSTLLGRISRARAQVLKYRRQNRSREQLHGRWS